MTVCDIVEIVGIAASCVVVVSAVRLVLATSAAQSVGRQVKLPGAVTVALGASSAIVVAGHVNLLSTHGFGVITLASPSAACMAIVGSSILASPAARGAAARRDQAEDLRSATAPCVCDEGPLDVSVLSSEWAEARRCIEHGWRRELRLEVSRRELVSWIAHDLRSPLAGLRAMAEALEDGIAEEPARFHRRIRTEVDRMARMVDDLLELSRSHGGVLHPAFEPIALRDLVSEAIGAADPLASLCNVRLGGHVDSGLEVFADPAGLSRVMSNLVTNAIRHTPADGVVEISGYSVLGGVEVSISDGCGGLCDQDMARVFDIGWQGSLPRSRWDTGLGRGTGLGLAIVKGIVEAHRGRVHVENLAASAGCRFVVTLPA